MAALGAIRFIPRFKTDYLALKARCGHAKFAINAVARELLVALRAMVKTGQPFKACDEPPYALVRPPQRIPSSRPYDSLTGAHFAGAFALGVLRISFVIPTIGVVWATLAELPIVLAASWVTCAWIARRSRISPVGQSIAMSISAFVLRISAEVVGVRLIFGVSLRDQMSSFSTPAGAMGLAG